MDPDLVRQQYEAERESGKALPASIFQVAGNSVKEFDAQQDAVRADSHMLPPGVAFQPHEPVHKSRSGRRVSAGIAAFGAAAIACGFVTVSTAAAVGGLDPYEAKTAALVTGLAAGAAAAFIMWRTRRRRRKTLF